MCLARFHTFHRRPSIFLPCHLNRWKGGAKKGARATPFIWGTQEAAGISFFIPKGAKRKGLGFIKAIQRCFRIPKWLQINFKIFKKVYILLRYI